MRERETEVNARQPTQKDRRYQFAVGKQDVTLAENYVFDPARYELSPISPRTNIEPEMFIYPSNAELVDHSEKSSMDLLFAEINKFPLLNRKLEGIIFSHIGEGHSVADLSRDKAFWEAFENADHKKVQQLLDSSSTLQELFMNANMRLVAKMASKFKGRLPMSDLIAEGTMGMQKAVEKFDVSKGYKFSTYGTSWILQAITRAIYDQGRSIRLPVGAHSVMGKIDRLVVAFFAEYERSPEFHELVEIGTKNGIRRSQIEAIVGRLINGSALGVVSLDVPVDAEGELMFGNTIRDDSAGEIVDEVISTIDREELLEVVNRTLDTKKRRVVFLRFGLIDGRPWTLREVGEEMNLTHERIRQLERFALQELRIALRVPI